MSPEPRAPNSKTPTPDPTPNSGPRTPDPEAMDKTYDPNQVERQWYRRWEREGYFVPGAGGAGGADGEPYCIMIPPPNVTGTLHMGHAFQDTIMDALIRYHRMNGRSTLWQPGTDHAGIATQMVVERQINAEGLTRQDLGRSAFVERIWRWKERSGNTITSQMRRMGASVDWAHERFTMDEGLSAAVQETFVRLYEDGLIYRGKRLVNWDPVLQTAVSDLEVVSEEEDGALWHIRYPRIDGSGHLEVATTRPETMLGDTAVAVHPADGRYRDLVGSMVELPLTERRIPVIADDMVDPEFGTGCVKITPAHDFNDYQVGERHALERINVLTRDARINGNAPARYRGLDRFEARAKIVEDLEARGLLVRTEPHRMTVPRGDRSHAVIEPYLTDQWFVKTGPLAEPSIRAVENGDIRFVPDHWAKTFFEWMRNIEDWCISRQIWWGHRIPAWYDRDGNVYVGRSEEEVRDKFALPPSLALEQDPDVLDTWYSSALWPFSTLGWPERTDRLETFYPTTVLVTGFDIIFFWVARMIMFGLRFMGDVPFREVYIHGLVRDGDGNKMSKSKGNILDPIDLIDGIGLDELIAKRTTGLMQPQLAPQIIAATRRQFPEGIPAYGTDALRFTFCSLATQGRDIRFDLGRIEGYGNFCNKLWNAARFVLLHAEGKDCGLGDGEIEWIPSLPVVAGAQRTVFGAEAERVLRTLEPLLNGPEPIHVRSDGVHRPVVLGLPEQWIWSLLLRTQAKTRAAMERYRLDLAAQTVYDFTWNEYCDWYLELSKTVLTDPDADPARLRGTRLTLVQVLETVLRLVHPMMPFVTEEIWQRVAPLSGRRCGPSIMLEPCPALPEDLDAPAAVEHMTWVKDLVLAIRRVRGELDLPPGRQIPVLLAGPSAVERRRLAGGASCVRALARAKTIDVLEAGTPAPKAATALLGGLEILVPLEGIIDEDAEIGRIERQIGKLGKELDRSRAKLENPSFRERAPAAVVEKERRRAAELETSVAKLESQLATLRSR